MTIAKYTVALLVSEEVRDRGLLDRELLESEEFEECRGCGGRINPDYEKCLRCE